MHIPKCMTTNIEVLTFEEAIKCSKAADYDSGKWIYVPDFYSEYRYILGTRGEHPLICIGVNPSTARPDALDNTLKSVERIAHSNGFDSFIMFNVYAQRATNPDDMEKVFNVKLHRENMKAFEYVLRLSESPSLWAAWGNIIEKRSYLKDCVKDMALISNKYDTAWYSCGKISAKGHPHHPLYLKSDSPLDRFDINRYIQSI